MKKFPRGYHLPENNFSINGFRLSLFLFTGAEDKKHHRYA